MSEITAWWPFNGPAFDGSEYLTAARDDNEHYAIIKLLLSSATIADNAILKMMRK